MVKQRQRRLIAGSAANNKVPTRLIDSSNSKTGMDLFGDDSWVIVKKQRVTILVPPLPAAKQSTTLDPGSSQLQPVPGIAIKNRSQPPNETQPWLHSIDEQEKSTSLASKIKIQIANKRHSAQPILKRTKLPRTEFTVGSESPVQVESFITRKEPGAFSLTKFQSELLDESISSLDRCLLLHQKMRASNLERKIQTAGGLSRWLASLGLRQFVRIFQKKRINKFQLVNLTMKKLKDMGADAVGPRRKLMHAIDCCLSQPYCFKSI